MLARKKRNLAMKNANEKAMKDKLEKKMVTLEQTKNMIMQSLKINEE